MDDAAEEEGPKPELLKRSKKVSDRVLGGVLNGFGEEAELFVDEFLRDFPAGEGVDGRVIVAFDTTRPVEEVAKELGRGMVDSG